MTHREALDKMNSMSANTLMETLQITFTDIGKNQLTATMPVNSAVHQPMGLLHGGATVALAETVASMAAVYFLGDSSKEVRGIEITANHLKSKKDGWVSATAKLCTKAGRPSFGRFVSWMSKKLQSQFVR